jgi:hypothetical protein
MEESALSEKFIQHVRNFTSAIKNISLPTHTGKNVIAPFSTSNPILIVSIIKKSSKNRRLQFENEFEPGKSNTHKTAEMKFVRSPLALLSLQRMAYRISKLNTEMCRMHTEKIYTILIYS